MQTVATVTIVLIFKEIIAIKKKMCIFGDYLIKCTTSAINRLKQHLQNT